MRRSLALLVLLAACGKTGGEPSHLYTLDQIIDAAHKGQKLGAIDPTKAIVFPGTNIPLLSPPFSTEATAFVGDGSTPGVAVLPSFAEGNTAAYFITEVWVGESAAWLQPEYVFIDAWDEKSPGKHIIAGNKIVFSVEPDGHFYSPYWQTTWVVAPPGMRPNTYTSAADILNAHLEMHPAGGRFCALSYQPFALAAPDGAAQTRPLSGEPVGKPIVTQGYANGKLVNVLDLGSDRFTWDENGYIEETPLYIPSRRDPDGNLTPLGLPSIGGTGPLGSRTPADAPNGKPRFGAFWHLYNVNIPDGSAVFLPKRFADLRAKMVDNGLLAPELAQALDEPSPDNDRYIGRIARHPDCLTGAAPFPDGCGFLDTDASIEDLSRSAVVATNTWASCPFIRYGGAAVGP